MEGGFPEFLLLIMCLSPVTAGLCILGRYDIASEEKHLSLHDLYGPEKGLFLYGAATRNLFGACVFGDCLGTFRNGVFSQFTRQQESHSGLDFPRGDGTPLIVVSKSRRFGSDSLEDVVHEGIHDGHGLARDTSVGVDLLQDFVDVDSEGFLPALLPLFLVASSH